MSPNDSETIIQCPCHPVCSQLGVETGMWCRYRKSDLPPPGMHAFNPKDTWCPAGVQANVLMLGYMLAGNTGDASHLEPVLAQVRDWARELRPEPVGYSPTGPNESKQEDK